MRNLFRRSKEPPATAPAPPLSQPVLKDTRLSPLDIPEILDRIFSFMDNRTLAIIVQQVCVQWFVRSKRLVHINAELDLGLDKKRREAIMARFPKATRIAISATVEQCWQTKTPVQHRLRALFSEKESKVVADTPIDMDIIQGKQSSPATPLRELVLGGDFLEYVTNFLKDVLPTCSTLTRLTLCSSSHRDPVLSLGNLLTAYPHLTTLELLTSPSASSSSIANSNAGGVFVIYEAGLFLVDDDPTPTFDIPSDLKLESIYFRNVSVCQEIVQSILNASPRLKELKLWNLYPRVTERQLYGYEVHLAPFDVPEFFEYLFNSTLELESFAFSMAGDQVVSSLEEMDVGRMLGRFDGSRNHPNARVQEWGFSPGICTALAQVPNRITNLELVPEMRSDTLEHANALHAFLCQAPHLLHLKARAVRLCVTRMDVNHFLGNPQWACRGLYTLQLGLSAALSTRETDIAPSDFRIACGYLVRLCPRLKELELAGTGQLGFGLDSGLVILARLQSLGKVVFEAYSQRNLDTTMNRIWAAVQPIKVDHVQRRITLRHWRQRLAKEATALKIIKANRETSFSADLEPAALPWMDQKYIGTLWDVKLALEALEADPGLEKCWRRLSTLGLCFGNDVYLKRIITARSPPLKYEDKTIHHLFSPRILQYRRKQDFVQ